jgi:hypothetical protein
VTELATAPHALYRFYDAAGMLLYVGITVDPGARWRAHRDAKPWWHQVANITIEPYSDRAAVLKAERAAIITEQPRHNVVHNRNRHLTSAPLLTAEYWASQMPDDCHDQCTKAGYANIYYPYSWTNGRAHYQCARGHHWTCGWSWPGLRDGIAPTNRGRRQMKEVIYA